MEVTDPEDEPQNEAQFWDDKENTHGAINIQIGANPCFFKGPGQ